MSAANADVYYRRGFDHLKTIARTLQNLRGAGALAHELIQNADDAAAATRLTFRFTRKGLEVVDDGGFESCGRLMDDPCRWELERRPRKAKKRCDFHAFQQLAGASKEDDPGLTGAFGVGFLSVYQVTDSPELFSAGQHWIIDESRREDQRIRGCSGCAEDHITDGTRFWLPWADQATPMRAQLASDPVPPAAQEKLYRDFCDAVPRAMVFLHKLEAISIEHHAHPARTFRRDPTADGVRIVGSERDEHWLILENDFADAAADLRELHPQIGDRHSRVRVAVLPGGRIKGVLHATLPTQILTGLPVHVDASFFPRLDRKGILLEGHEGDWNRTAIECAADLLADKLEELARALGPKPFWRLIHAAYDGRARGRRGAGDSLGGFWDAIRRELAAACVMATASGDWAVVSETVLPARKDPPDWLALLEEIGIHTVAEELRKTVGAMGAAIPTATLDLRCLVSALHKAGLGRGPFERSELPAGLTSQKRRNLLRRHLSALVAAEPVSKTEISRLRQLALWRTTKREYASLESSYIVERDTAHLFGGFIEYALIDRDAQDKACAALLDLGDHWGADEGVDALADDDSVLPVDGLRAHEVLDWLSCRLPDLTAAQLGRLHDRPIVPTTLGVSAPSMSVIAGGFKDPLSVTAEVESHVVATHEALLTALTVTELSFGSYVQGFVPTALEQGVSIAALLHLLDVCVDHRRIIDADELVRRVLTREAWVPCRDGCRRPPASVYFETDVVCAVLGDAPPLLHDSVAHDGGAGDLLRALGVQSEPRSEDIITYVRKVTDEAPDRDRIDAVVAVLRHLESTRRKPEADDPFADLHTLPWLPTDDGHAWAPPETLFFTRERSLFATTGRFIALARKEQDDFRPILSDLGVRQTPTPALVVGHLIELVESGEPVDARLVSWLNSDRHWTDDALEELRDRVWMATADGTLAAPSRIFRQEHALAPYLPILHESLRGFTSLLDALGVPIEPTAENAIDLLLRLAHEADAGPISPEGRKAIRACWRRVEQDRDADLGPLAGERVALGSDDRLYQCAELLLNDMPSIGRAFGEVARSRFVRQSDAHLALRRAGVRNLSECLRSRVIATGAEADGRRVADRIRTRQPQLARIVGGEGGRWADVLEFARTLEVEAYESVTVDRYLEGFDGLPPTPPVDVSAHYLGGGRLVVAIQTRRMDWFGIGFCLREILCPSASPAVASAIEGALAAESGTAADDRISRLSYPELDQEYWDELQLVLDEQRARDEAAARYATEGDPDEDVGDDDSEMGADVHGGHEAEAEDVDGTHQTEAEDVDDDAETDAAADDVDDDHDADDNGAAASADDDDRRSRNGSRERAGSAAPSHRRRASVHRGRQSASRSTGQDESRRPARHDTRSRDGSEWWHTMVSARKPAADPADIDTHRQAGRRTAIDQAGMAAVARHEEAAGRHPVPQPPNNPGFDVDSTNTAGETLRLIEVKSLAGEWGPGGFPKLTPTQWEMALDERDGYWLYVVEHAESDTPQITRIQDPAGAATRYVVDPGWRALGEPERREPLIADDELALVDDAIRQLCEEAINAGAAMPTVLAEIGEAGVVIEAAWPDRRVGIVSPRSSAAVDGWTLVRSDEIGASDLLALLDGASSE